MNIRFRNHAVLPRFSRGPRPRGLLGQVGNRRESLLTLPSILGFRTNWDKIRNWRRLLREGGLSLLPGEVGNSDSLFNAIWVLGPQSGGEAKWNTQRALFAFGVRNVP